MGNAMTEGLGIFRPTASNGLSFRFRKWATARPPKVDARQQNMRQKMLQVADAYADGATSHGEVSKLTGIPERTIDRLWRQIKAELGAQAV